MELAAALHHNCEVGLAQHVGLRAQKTANSAGARPGVLKDPEQQGGAATVGCVAAPEPLLEVSSMAGRDSVDGTTLRYLLKHAIEMWKVLEEERRKKEEEEQEKAQKAAKLQAHLHAILSSSWARETLARGSQERKEEKRRKKKRKKKKLPKTSSLSSLHGWYGRERQSCCASHRLRQWHVRCAGFADCDAPRDVFPLVDDWPKMFDTMAGMDQKDSIPRVWCAHRRLRQWHVLGWHCWYVRCVPYCCRQAQMLGIMAGMLLLQFINEVINIPVVAQRPFPMVLAIQQTMEIPQLLEDMVVKAPIVQVVQVVRVSHVLLVKITLVIPQLQLVVKIVVRGQGRSRARRVQRQDHRPAMAVPLVVGVGAW